MPDTYSAEVAVRVLEMGGNAIDAAVAVGFVLAVTYPEAGNIAGGGFMNLVFEGKSAFLDYRETAPGRATRNMFVTDSTEAMKSSSIIGHLAVGVPGTVAGLWAAHQRYGRMPWADLVIPAIKLAQRGFVVHPKLAERWAEKRGMYKGRTNIAEHFDGLTAGRIFQQPELARTLARIADQGPQDFYHGETARLIVADMKAHGGIVTAEDLKNYRPKWRPPLMAKWRDYQIQTSPPPSAGGLTVIQLLRMKDLLRSAFAGLEHNTAPYLHLTAELQKRVFADRAEYLGDPDFVKVPVDALIDDAYLARRVKEVQTESISPPSAVYPGLGSSNTVHFSILDRDGNAVANTYTLNTSFGSGVVVPQGGFLLNNEMDDFAVAPDTANYYGLVGRDANAIAPGKRMLSSMAPTLLLRKGEVVMVVGAVGGSTIPTSIYQVIVNVLDFHMSAKAAVSAPRFHHQGTPGDLITHLPEYPPNPHTVADLAKLGYRVEPHFFTFGHLQLIWKPGEGMQAASDPLWRGQSQVLEDLP